MNKNIKPVEIVVIGDRSGNMQSIVNDAVGGYNGFKQAQIDLAVPANLTLVLFNDTLNPVTYRTPINETKELTLEEYRPSGGTALNDAIGKTITEFRALHTEGEIDKAIFCIFTDGGENASSEYCETSKIKELIKLCEQDYGWEFVFLNANVDAFTVGAAYGFSLANTANFVGDSHGMQGSYRGMASKVATYSSSVAMGASDISRSVAMNAVNLQDVVDEELPK